MPGTAPRSHDATLARGREACRRRAWAEAHAALSLADREQPLTAVDLESLSLAAYLIGRDDEYLATLDRAFERHLQDGATRAAIRCAFWLGLRLMFRGEVGRGTGWLARAQRLLEREGPCAEQGYLLLAAADQRLAGGDLAAARADAAAAVAIGECFTDPELTACALQLQGRILLQQGEIRAGLAELDQAMLAVTAGTLSPLVTGLVYCSVIEGCQEVYALGRAREWTQALAHWCDAQPDMLAFSGVCLVHRSELMQLRGAWPAALEEARRACERCSRIANQRATAAAYYQEAEVHRLCGDYGAAEEGYRSANRLGQDPQPGLALLRLAQGQTETALAAIGRALGATTGRLERVRLLPACVEIGLAAGDLAAAGDACRELEDLAAALASELLQAMADHARGAVELAAGNARAALSVLHRARQALLEAEAPYLAAQTRTLAALACRALGDEDGALLELDAARLAYTRLGAAPDLERIDALTRSAPRGERCGLTPRELQVLRLVAAGKTNKAIAAELRLSEKTIDRHVSNIFVKLDVPSRTAATAFGYRHKLL